MIRKHNTQLREAIGGTLPYFVGKFYEKGFISKETKNKITSMSGVGAREKADELLDNIQSHLGSARDKKERFYVFITIFSDDVAYKDLTDTLKQYYAGN